jgi:hypothetical protein
MDLVATGDIAKRAGVTADAIAQWMRRYPDAPKPLAVTSAGAIWEWSDWEKWLCATGRCKCET